MCNDSAISVDIFLGCSRRIIRESFPNFDYVMRGTIFDRLDCLFGQSKGCFLMALRNDYSPVLMVFMYLQSLPPFLQLGNKKNTDLLEQLPKKRFLMLKQCKHFAGIQLV